MSGWAIEALVGSTLLMLAVLALRRPVARLFGPRAAYALWALPALRMVLPTLPGWTPLVMPWASAESSGDMTLGLAVGASPAELAAVQAPPLVAAMPPLDAEPALQLVDLAALLPALWLAGAVLWLGWQLLRYRRFVLLALADASLLTRSGGTDVYLTPAVAGPMAAGIFRRRIFLPADFRRRYAPAEQRLALLHEGAHHDRGDLVANFAGLAVVALHWWNPVAHIAWRAFRADQELACDATVLAGQDADRAAYGSAVLKSACDRAPTAACAMNQKSQLKKRIAMMKAMPMSVARRVSGGLMTAALIGGGLLLTASGNPTMSPAPLASPMLAEPTATLALAEVASPPAPVLTLAAGSNKPLPPAPPAPPSPPPAPAEAAPPAPPTPPSPPSPPTAATRAAVPAKPATPAKAVTAADAADAATRDAADRADAATRAAADRADAIAEAAAEAANAAAEASAAAAEAAADAIEAANDGSRYATISLQQVRANMAASCARQGKKIDVNARWEDLALCGSKRFHAEIARSVHASLAATKASLNADKQLEASIRNQALAEVDAAMRSVRRELKAD